MFYKYINKSTSQNRVSRVFSSAQIKRHFLDPQFNNPCYKVSYITLQNAISEALQIPSTLLLLKAFLEPLNTNLKIISGQYYPTCSPLSFWPYIILFSSPVFSLSSMFSGSNHTYRVFITIVECNIFYCMPVKSESTLLI